MRRLMASLLVLFLLVFGVAAFAEEECPTVAPVVTDTEPLIDGNLFGADLSETTWKDADVTIEASYASKYKWYGRSMFGSTPVWSARSVIGLPKGLSPFGGGFYADIAGYFPAGSGAEEATEMDYSLFWHATANEGMTSQLEVFVDYTYYDLIKSNRHSDGQEIGATAFMPNIINISDVILIGPKYRYAILWDQNPEGIERYNGNVQVGGLVCQINAIDGLPLIFNSDITYDNIGDVEAGFSHTTLGLETKIQLTKDSYISPFVNYQMRIDDTLKDEDGFWGGVTMAYTF